MINKPKQARVHQLVAEAFLGPQPKGLHTCHGVKGKLCNEATNLTYATPKQNQAD